MAVPKPDYLSRDYAGLRDSMLQYAAQAYPEWKPSSDGDFGMVLLDLFSYMGDIVSYYTDRAQFENYLGTATQRDSVLGIAYILGYVPNSGTPASGTVELRTDAGLPSITVPAGTKITTNRVDALDGPVTVETAETVTVPASGESNVTVPVVEGESENHVKIGESTGQPSQTLVLPHTGVYRDTIRIFVEDPAGSTVFNSGVNSVTAREWLSVDHLLNADPTDTEFEVQYQDNSALIVFGDDINGAIPATGIQIFASYRHGVGSSGNVAAGMVRLLNERTLAGVHVARDTGDAWLSSAMTGGTDPETTDSIRYNAPRAYRTQNRVVTLEDFVDLALGVEGVTKASVIAGTFTSVTLFIVGPDGGAPSATLTELVKEKVEERTLAGVTVSVTAPEFVAVNFGTSEDPIVVELYPQFSQNTAKAAVERELRTLIADMPFNERLSLAKVYDAITGVEGVRYVDIPVLARADAPQSGTSTINPRVFEVFAPGTFAINVIGGVA